jgi:hypothetical protein
MKPPQDALRHPGDCSPEDQEVSPILDIINRDILCIPEKLRLIDEQAVCRFRVLVGDVEIELERPLSPDDADA